MDNNQTRSMEAVHNFTNELFSLYDFKVPISKAKMAAITKSAMKAIKFYKHVVQNVEKFILKCKPEYKIPGLYVIDSIVRQSRHQFGTEKDVFAPRFARNMEETFAHLFRCSQEDKSKIIRVLNLWQKNNVFAPEVIQPLFDLANPDHPVHQNFMQQQQQQQAQNDASQNGAGGGAGGSMNVVRESPLNAGVGMKDDQNTEMLNATNLQKFQYQQLMMQQQQSAEAAAVGGATHDSIKFNKQLLEFDYGSDGDEDKTDGMQNMNLQMQYQAAMTSSAMQLPYQFSKVLDDPNIIKQLQNIKNIDVQRYLNEIPSGMGNVNNQLDMNSQPMLGSGLTLANINSLRGPQTINLIDNSKDQDVEFVGGDTMMMPEVIPVSSRSPTPKHTSSSKRRRSRSYSRERYGRRRRSRSRSTRSRSRSPRNRRRSSRERPRDKEREKQREIEKERRRKGLPDIKKDHLSVCSTTLWVGHLSKLVQQEELSDTFQKYGEIISIDMIPPRGCAYIVMNRRQDAHKAMQQLKNHKMQNRTITISWAAGKGVKGKEWKDYFDQTLGVTYVPFSKLTHETDFVSLEEGGMYDEDTVPQWVKDKIKQPTQQVPKDGLIMPPSFFGLPDVSVIDTSQPPPNAQTLMPAMPAFPLGARLLMPNVLPLGVPPPNMLGMVFPQAAGANDKSLIPPPGLLGFPLAAAQQTITAPQQQTGDDHMDIEMEDEHHTSLSSKDSLALLQQAAFYNQPPPQLALLMQQQQQQQQQQQHAAALGNSQNDDDFNRVAGNRNNRSQSRENDRNDYRNNRSGSQRSGDRRSDNYNNSRSNNRWGSDNNNRDGRDRRSRDDFSASRDDYDRRQGGFSNRGGFSGNQQMRGNRGNFQSRGGNGSGSGGSNNFANRPGRDGNMRGGFNNFNDRPSGSFRDDSRGGRAGRNWNRDDNNSDSDRRQNFRSGNRNQQSSSSSSSRWTGGDNQKQDNEEGEWGGEGNDEIENNQNDSSNQCSAEENQESSNKQQRRNSGEEEQEGGTGNYNSNDGFEKSQNEDDVPPPGTDDYDQQDNSIEFSAVSNEPQQQQQQQQQQQPPPMESFESFNNDAKSNDNSNNGDFTNNEQNESSNSRNDEAVVENAGNTTPLCDENEARE